MTTKFIEQLQKAQFEFWPDSKLVSIWEALNEWPTDYPDWIEKEGERVFERFKHDLVHARSLRAQKMLELQAQYRERTLRSIAVCLANAMNYQQPVQFYQCGLNEDGTYQYKGCRYGLKGYEYYSGFGLG